MSQESEIYAFPHDKLNGETKDYQTAGMTLRDWFAGMALQGMLAHSRGDPARGYKPRDPSQHWHDAITQEAYELADAMLTKREKGQDQ